MKFKINKINPIMILIALGQASQTDWYAFTGSQKLNSIIFTYYTIKNTKIIIIIVKYI